jgi:hypothetical protein
MKAAARCQSASKLRNVAVGAKTRWGSVEWDFAGRDPGRTFIAHFLRVFLDSRSVPLRIAYPGQDYNELSAKNMNLEYYKVM